MFVRVLVGTEDKTEALMIPEQSIQEDQAGKFVMIVDSENVVDVRRVKTGRASKGRMKIVDGHCIFYDNGCKVHKGRPWRCGQWPLHPSILSDENNFLTISDSCPGINRDISYEKFCQILRKLYKIRIIFWYS